MSTAAAMFLQIKPAMVSTTSELPGYRITRSLGVAEGISVSLYTGVFPAGQENVILDTMREAFVAMLTQAADQGADAIVGLRYTMPSSSRERVVVAYGTAVNVEKI